MIDIGAASARIEGFRASDDGTRWTYAGSLTFDNAAGICAAASSLALPRRGIVDLSGIEAVDSSAVAVLLALKRRAAEEGTLFTVDNVPPALSALATLYGVDEILLTSKEPVAALGHA